MSFKWLFPVIWTTCLALASNLENSRHDDHRSRFFKLEFVPAVQLKLRLDPQAAAENHLRTHADNYGVGADLSDLQLDLIKESLIGYHFHYQQLLHGIKVQHAEIIVSISKDSGQVYQVYNNYFPVSGQDKARQAQQILAEDDAFDLAWMQMRVHGRLIAQPKIELVYLPEEQSFRLVYLTDLSVQAPYGHWQHVIDAQTGEIREVRDSTVSRHPVAQPDFAAYQGPIHDRHLAFARFASESTREALPKTAQKAAGTAKVFDPDPVTTLGTVLQDTDPASNFLPAYLTRDLRDISLNNGTYSLVGPWVKIQDFEAPEAAPSTSTSGDWTQVRGNNAFNDVMSYFHIDQSQRYIQSLGFAGSTGIQFRSIPVDSNGVDGEDNSYYAPSQDLMSFGHGCVDDNEDAFVILHEYGHAIHFDINRSWSGGDTGAMGEGFGDYWAASYKFSTSNGPNFHPEWAFPFDGHNNCWAGRAMNRTDARYVHTINYLDHQFVMGFISDELWSTPLFQSLLELHAQGVPRSQVDKIILQAQFGLGSRLKMRDMASAIVNTAQVLYPSGPHKDVFTAKFVAQSILIGDTQPPPSGPVLLENGQTLSELSASSGSLQHYYLVVPPGASNLLVNISGGSGDCDLYVKFANQPTTSSYDFRPYKSGNQERVALSAPASGNWYIMLRGYSSYSGLSLSVSYTPAEPSGSWTTEVVDQQTPHPYLKNESYSFSYEKPGALKVAVHFVTLESERNYDYLTVKDQSDSQKFRVSGNLISNGTGTTFGSPDGWVIVDGNRIQIELTTDNSVQKYGYQIDAVKYFQ